MLLSQLPRIYVGSARTEESILTVVHMGVSQNYGYHFKVPIIRIIIFSGL